MGAFMGIPYEQVGHLCIIFTSSQDQIEVRHRLARNDIMTLIARMTFSDTPAYLGDLLLSRAGEHLDKVDIPAADDINSLLPAERTRSISGLRQKLNILSDRLIVAWCGSSLQARVAMREMLEMEEKGTLSHDNLIAYIDNANPKDVDDLSLLATICTPDGNGQGGLHFEHFDFNFTQMNNETEDHSVSGTGSDTFLEILPQATNGLKKTARETNEAFIQLESLALGIANQFIGREILTGQNLLHWWGGGIEVATLRDAKFQKTGNVLHTFWIVDPDHNSLFLKPTFLKYDYFNDALVIQKFDCRPSNGKIAVKAHDYRIYTPLLKGPNVYNFAEFPLPPLTYDHLCCHLQSRKSDGEFDSVNFCFYNQQPFLLTPMRDRLAFSFERSFLLDMEATSSKLADKYCRFVGLKSAL